MAGDPKLPPAWENFLRSAAGVSAAHIISAEQKSAREAAIAVALSASRDEAAHVDSLQALVRDAELRSAGRSMRAMLALLLSRGLLREPPEAPKFRD